MADGGCPPIAVALVAAACAAFSPLEPAHAQCRLTVGYEEEPPFHYVDSTGQVAGIDADLVTAVLGTLGCEPVFVELPWSRTMEEVETGRIDIAPAARYLEERTAFAYFSLPYKLYNYWLITRSADTVTDQDLRTFLEQGHTLGIARRWHFPDPVQQVLEDPRFRGQIEETAFFQPLIPFLLRGHVDGIVGNLAIAALLIREHGYDPETSIRSTILASDPVHFLLSRQSMTPEQVGSFDDALRTLIDSDEYEAIFQRHGGSLAMMLSPVDRLRAELQ